MCLLSFRPKCFYINLPIGGLAAGFIFFFLEARPALGAASDDRPFWKKCVQLDWVGTAITMCHTVCITLGLEYGGVQKSWKDGSVVTLLVMIPVSFGLLVGWTMWIGEKRAMVPLRFMKRRVILFVLVHSFCPSFSLLLFSMKSEHHTFTEEQVS